MFAGRWSRKPTSTFWKTFWKTSQSHSPLQRNWRNTCHVYHSSGWTHVPPMSHGACTLDGSLQRRCPECSGQQHGWVKWPGEGTVQTCWWNPQHPLSHSGSPVQDWAAEESGVIRAHASYVIHKGWKDIQGKVSCDAKYPSACILFDAICFFGGIIVFKSSKILCWSSSRRHIFRC